MKKLIRMFGGFVLLVSLVLLSGSFTEPSLSVNADNGIDVEVVHGPGVGGISIRCPGESVRTTYYAENGTVVYKDGNPVVYSFIVKLPEDHCYSNLKRAAVLYQPDGGMVTIAPNGVVTYRSISK